MKRLLLALLLVFAAVPTWATTCVNGTAGVAPTATLTFTAPTVNTDGTPIATPLSYSLYQGATSGGEKQVATGLTSSPVTVTTGLVDGTSVYFTLTTTDANGTVSAQSNEVCKTFAKGVPGTITITVQ